MAFDVLSFVMGQQAGKASGGSSGGGESGSMSVASGEFSVTTPGPLTIEHGLGAVPDLIIVCAQNITVSNLFGFRSAIGYSEKFQALINSTYGNICHVVYSKTNGSSSAYYYSVKTRTDTIETTTIGENTSIHSANADSFTIGSSLYKMTCAGVGTFSWIAISGLS